jgi:hypothetical protein
MSVKIMSLVFDAAIGDSPGVSATTKKFILLAYADHANDDGISTYPSLTRLEHKTELTRPTVMNAIDALIKDNLIALVGKSPRGTNEYKINIEILETLKRGGKATLPVKSLYQGSKATLPVSSKATLPEPSLQSSLNHPSVPQNGTHFPEYSNSAQLQELAEPLQDATVTVPILPGAWGMLATQETQVKNPTVLVALQENAKRQIQGDCDLSEYPEQIRPILEIICGKNKAIQIPKRKRRNKQGKEESNPNFKAWINLCNGWIQTGFTVQDIKNTLDYMQEHRLIISSPFSIDKTMVGIKNLEFNQPKSPYKDMTTWTLPAEGQD